MEICMHPKQNERAIRKTKALMSKRKPEQSFCYAPQEEGGCIFYMRFFSRILSREWRRRRIARIIHIPGCICRFALGFCKNIKKRTETLYQSFSPFMVEHTGFEPVTSTMRMQRATNCANAPNILAIFYAALPSSCYLEKHRLGMSYEYLVLPTVLMPHILFARSTDRT